MNTKYHNVQDDRERGQEGGGGPEQRVRLLPRQVTECYWLDRTIRQMIANVDDNDTNDTRDDAWSAVIHDACDEPTYSVKIRDFNPHIEGTRDSLDMHVVWLAIHGLDLLTQCQLHNS